MADTHALAWYTVSDRKLGKGARRLFAEADAGHAVIYISALALIEAAEGLRAGRLRLPLGFEDWLSRLLRNPAFQPVDFTAGMAIRSRQLFAIPERGDRLLAATALELGCPLMTRDARIAASGLVRTVW